MRSQYLSSVAVVEPIKKQVCDVINRATRCDSTEEAAFLADRCAALFAELREYGFSVDVLFQQDEAPDFLIVLRQLDLLVRTSIRLYQSWTTLDDRKAAVSFFNYADRRARHIGFQLAMMSGSGGLRISFRPFRPGKNLSVSAGEAEPLAVSGHHYISGPISNSQFGGAP